LKITPVLPARLRGTQASIAVRAMPTEHVAAALGQTGPEVTRRHYLAPGAEQDGQQRADERRPVRKRFPREPFPDEKKPRGNRG